MLLTRFLSILHLLPRQSSENPPTECAPYTCVYTSSNGVPQNGAPLDPSNPNIPNNQPAANAHPGSTSTSSSPGQPIANAAPRLLIPFSFSFSCLTLALALGIHHRRTAQDSENPPTECAPYECVYEPGNPVPHNGAPLDPENTNIPNNQIDGGEGGTLSIVPPDITQPANPFATGGNNGGGDGLQQQQQGSKHSIATKPYMIVVYVLIVIGVLAVAWGVWKCRGRGKRGAGGAGTTAGEAGRKGFGASITRKFGAVRSAWRGTSGGPARGEAGAGAGAGAGEGGEMAEAAGEEEE
ncbi:hypothetical protein MMC20_004181 [Loxospora ochrophaea]|nr:hypothetical protein [Loxospora ochrophaea]